MVASIVSRAVPGNGKSFRHGRRIYVELGRTDGGDTREVTKPIEHL